VSTFSGMYFNNLDGKGRLIIPAPFRDVLLKHYSPKLIVVIDALDPCLLAYPEEQWNKQLEKVNSLPQYNKNVRFYMRKVVASASVCDIDKQGRILVPAAHRKSSGLKSETVIAGQGTRLEIWDRHQWDKATNPDTLDQEAFIRDMEGFNL
jgi:MraZ protein